MRRPTTSGASEGRLRVSSGTMIIGEPEIVFTTDRGVAAITLNAPARKNALITGMAERLIAACERVEVNLLPSTHLRIMRASVQLVARFLRIGIHPGGGHFLLMGRAAGREAAAAVSILGENLDSRRAVATGLAWECCADEEEM